MLSSLLYFLVDLGKLQGFQIQPYGVDCLDSTVHVYRYFLLLLFNTAQFLFVLFIESALPSPGIEPTIGYVHMQTSVNILH